MFPPSHLCPSDQLHGLVFPVALSPSNSCLLATSLSRCQSGLRPTYLTQTSDSTGPGSTHLNTPSFRPLLLETCLPPLPDLKDKPGKSNWSVHGQPKDHRRFYHPGLYLYLRQTKRRLLDPVPTNQMSNNSVFPQSF